MSKTEFIDDLLTQIIKFKQKKSKIVWYDNILKNLDTIHKRNPHNKTIYKVLKNKTSEYLIYIVVYNDMYVDVKVYVPELKDCFLLKINCKINNTLLSIHELVIDDLDIVAKYLDSSMIENIFTEIEECSKKDKILGINIYIKNFVSPYNKEIENILTKKYNYRLVNTNVGSSLFKSLTPPKKVSV